MAERRRKGKGEGEGKSQGEGLIDTVMGQSAGECEGEASETVCSCGPCGTANSGLSI